MAVFGGWRITRAGIIFIVGILILGGLVTGGIFLVKNHGEAVRRDQAVKVAEQTLKDNSEIATQPVNETNETEEANEGDTAANNSATPAPAETNPGTTTPSTAGSANELPVTGIDDLLVVGRSLILALLAFSTLSYVISRRASRQL